MEELARTALEIYNRVRTEEESSKLVGKYLLRSHNALTCLLLGWTMRFFHDVWRRKYSLNFFRFNFQLKLNSFEFVQCCKKGNLFRIFHVLTFFVSSFFPSSTTGVAWASSSACSPCCAVAAPQPSQSRTSTTHPHSCWRC